MHLHVNMTVHAARGRQAVCQPFFSTHIFRRVDGQYDAVIPLLKEREKKISNEAQSD